MHPPAYAGAAAARTPRSSSRSTRGVPRLKLDETTSSVPVASSASTSSSSVASSASANGGQKRKKDVAGPSLHSPRTRANSNNDEPRKRPAQQHKQQHKHKQLSFFPQQHQHQHQHQHHQQQQQQQQQQRERFQKHQQQLQRQQQLEQEQSKNAGLSRKEIKSERERERRAAVRNLFLAISVELNMREEGDNSALDQTQVLDAAIKKLKEPNNLGPMVSQQRGSRPAAHARGQDDDASTSDDSALSGHGPTIKSMYKHAGSGHESNVTPAERGSGSRRGGGSAHLQKQLQHAHSSALSDETYMPSTGMPSPVVMPLPTTYDGGFPGDVSKWSTVATSPRRNSLYGRRDSAASFSDPFRIPGDARRTSDASMYDFLATGGSFGVEPLPAGEDPSLLFQLVDGDAPRRDSVTGRFGEVSPRSYHPSGSDAAANAAGSVRKGRGRSSSCFGEGVALAYAMPPPVLYEPGYPSPKASSRNGPHPHLNAANYARGQMAGADM